MYIWDVIKLNICCTRRIWLNILTNEPILYLSSSGKAWVFSSSCAWAARAARQCGGPAPPPMGWCCCTSWRGRPYVRCLCWALMWAPPIERDAAGAAAGYGGGPLMELGADAEAMGPTLCVQIMMTWSTVMGSFYSSLPIFIGLGSIGRWDSYPECFYSIFAKTLLLNMFNIHNKLVAVELHDF